MQRKAVYNFLETNKEKLFPNKKYSELQIEEAMISSSDILGNYLNGSFFKDINTAFFMTVILGIWGVGMFYVGEIKRGILRLVLIILPSFIGIPIALISGIMNGGNIDPSEMLNSLIFIIFIIGYVLFFIVTLLMDILQIKEICRRANCAKILKLAAKYYQVTPTQSSPSNRISGAPNDLFDNAPGNLDLDTLTSDFKE